MKNLFKTLLMAVFAANLLALPVFSADFSGSTYSETDASNTAASPNGWASGTYFNQVEPIGRATLGGLKRWFNRVNCTVTSGGSSNAYTYTPVNTSYPIAYNTGDDYCFIANFANTGAATINVNSLGAKNIYKIGSSGVTALTGGEIQIGQPVLETYDGTEFVMLSQTANIAAGYAPLASPTFTGTPSLPTGTTAVTQTAGTSGTSVATTGFVNGTALTLTTGSTAATQAANTSNTTVATTAFANPGTTLGGNGFTELPSGLIIQWGETISIATGSHAITWPESFPNAVYSATFTPTNNSSNGPIIISTLSTSGATLQNNTGNGQEFYYFAIGD